jgi:hypothetical protein
VRGAERIDRPAAVFAVGDQRTDANDRMVDVLGELVAQLGANLVVALTLVAVGGGKTSQVRDRFDIPNDHASHV